MSVSTTSSPRTPGDPAKWPHPARLGREDLLPWEVGNFSRRKQFAELTGGGGASNLGIGALLPLLRPPLGVRAFHQGSGGPDCPPFSKLTGCFPSQSSMGKGAGPLSGTVLSSAPWVLLPGREPHVPSKGQAGVQPENGAGGRSQFLITCPRALPQGPHQAAGVTNHSSNHTVTVSSADRLPLCLSCLNRRPRPLSRTFTVTCASLSWLYFFFLLTILSIHLFVLRQGLAL